MNRGSENETIHGANPPFYEQLQAVVELPPEEEEEPEDQEGQPKGQGGLVGILKDDITLAVVRGYPVVAVEDSVADEVGPGVVGRHFRLEGREKKGRRMG